jgi:hypothetical protein
MLLVEKTRILGAELSVTLILGYFGTPFGFRPLESTHAVQPYFTRFTKSRM